MQQQAPESVTKVREPSRIGLTVGLVYGVGAYLVFLAVFLGLIAFVENAFLPTTLDAGRSSSSLTAALIDVGLLALFGVQHSVMARGSFKAWWTKVVPASAERSTYVLVSSIAVGLIIWQWRPLTGVIWNVSNPVGRWVLIGISLFGWLFALISSNLINPFDLFGLRQVYLAWRRKPYTSSPFRVTSLYRLVRHPLMLGFLIAFWAAPRLTVGHLLFSLVTTAYILISVHFLEERDLAAAFGDTYAQYRRRVPMLLPLPRPSRARNS
jgi:protein-S-isoprenylcysteine O-methyltransferase Ste14